jgi:membrane protein DedA with SNARE-associated domain
VFLGRWVAGRNALGGLAWATSVGLLAYHLGPAAEQIFKTIGVVGVAVAVLAIVAFLTWRRLRNSPSARRRPADRARSSSGAEDEPS